METKICTICGKEKILSSFTRDRRAKTGFASRCKECNANKTRVYTSENLALVRERKRLFYLEKRDSHTIYTKKYCALNPDKKRAHGLVAKAIKSGKLTKQPCQICGSISVQAHHEDYSKPFDVIWLCFKHHRQLHYEKSLPVTGFEPASTVMVDDRLPGDSLVY